MYCGPEHPLFTEDIEGQKNIINLRARCIKFGILGFGTPFLNLIFDYN